MTDPEKKTKAKAKNTTKSESVTAEPYLKKDDTSKSGQAEPVKNKSSMALTLALLLLAVVVVPTTIYKFKEQLNSPATQKVVQVSPQVNLENTSATSETITPASTDNNDTNMRSTQEPETVVNNNEVIQQRRQAYSNEMQSRQKQYQAMMATRQQEMAKAAEAQKEKYNRFRQEQLEAKKEIQEVQKQIYQLNERLRYLIQKTHTRNNR